MNQGAGRSFPVMMLALAAAALLSAVSCRKSQPPSLELVYRVKFDESAKPDKSAVLAHTIEVIQKRLDPDGRRYMDIRPSGEDRFVLKFWGVAASEAPGIDALIMRGGMLRFCLVHEKPEDLAAARRGEAVPNCTPFLPMRDPKTGMILREMSLGARGGAAYTGRPIRWHLSTFKDLKDASDPNTPNYMRDGEWYLVEHVDKPPVTGQYLSDVKANTDQFGAPAVAFEFGDKGRKDFEKLTENNINRMLAIILDDDLYSAPTIKSRIAGAGVITGNFTKQEVDDLVTVLRAGALPAPIERVPDQEPAK